MKAIQVNKAELGPVVIQAELQKPEPGLGEILIHVHAVGVRQSPASSGVQAKALSS